MPQEASVSAPKEQGLSGGGIIHWPAVFRKFNMFCRRIPADTFVTVVIFIGFSYMALRSFLTFHLSIDDYHSLYNYPSIFEIQCSQGRHLMVLLSRLFIRLGVDIIRHQSFLMSAGILLMGWIAYRIFAAYSSLKPSLTLFDRLLMMIGISIIVFNCYCAEIFTFSAFCFFYPLTLFFAVQAAIVLVEKTTSLRFLWSFLLLLLSVFIYQTCATAFLGLAILFSIVVDSEKPIQDWLCSLTKILGMYFSAGLLNLLSIKFFSQQSYAQTKDLSPGKNFWENISAIIKWIEPILLDSYHMLPRFFLLAAVLGLLILLAIRKEKKPLMQALCLSFLIIGASLAPHLIVNAVWVVPRTVIMISAIPGFILLAGISNSGWASWQKGSIFTISAIYLIIGLNSLNAVSISQIATNRQDQMEARIICHEIEKQEHQRKTRVIRICFGFDPLPSYSYPGEIAFGDINVRAMRVSWSRPGLFKFATGRDFEMTIADGNAFQELFGNRNWDLYDSEQVIVQQDTAYVAVY